MTKFALTAAAYTSRCERRREVGEQPTLRARGHRSWLGAGHLYRRWPYIVGAMLSLPGFCLATDVRVVAVTAGQSADVVIEGGAPVTLTVGETLEGVKLLRVNRNGAVLRIDGVTKTLPLVAAPSSVMGDMGSGTVTLSANARGQFWARGTVNGRSMRFLVDTGAEVTTLSRAEARRIRLDYRRGTPAMAATVSGVVNGWRVSLDSVRIGKVTVRNVDAIVVDNDMPVALLGMSFLDRFDMHRHGSTLVLQRRR